MTPKGRAENCLFGMFRGFAHVTVERETPGVRQRGRRCERDASHAVSPPQPGRAAGGSGIPQ